MIPPATIPFNVLVEGIHADTTAAGGIIGTDSPDAGSLGKRDEPGGKDGSGCSWAKAVLDPDRTILAKAARVEQSNDCSLEWSHFV